MIRNVVFDMGNVLLDFNPEVCLDLYCSTKKERSIIRKELFGGPEWVMGDKGEIKDKERYGYVKERVPGEYWHALKQCSDNWAVCMEPMEGAKEFCSYLKGKGYRIYVLSNASDLFYEYFPKFAPIEYFDGIIVSSDHHMLKPDLGIYELFLDKFNLKPEECLFIDDRPENILGAQKAGMQGIVFGGAIDYAQVRELFKL